MSEDYTELSGAKLGAWFDLPPTAVCNRCGHKTWAITELDTEDHMPQPDGNPCGGRFVSVHESPGGAA
jgi:hypothetical protein